jgi:hypothetical protein
MSEMIAHSGSGGSNAQFLERVKQERTRRLIAARDLERQRDRQEQFAAREIRAILRRARARYYAALPTDRPALDCCTAVIGLFGPDEMLTFSRLRAWPLSVESIDFIRQSPRVRKRKFKKRQQRLLSRLFALAMSERNTLRELLWAVLCGQKGEAA